jgi:hypothetical protein
MMKIEGSGSISQRHGSADPDPRQNVMDPENWRNKVLSDFLVAPAYLVFGVPVVLAF